VLAFETDLLEHDDLFEGSVVVERKVAALKAQVPREIDRVQAMGGAVAAGRDRLHEERAGRLARRAPPPHRGRRGRRRRRQPFTTTEPIAAHRRHRRRDHDGRPRGRAAGDRRRAGRGGDRDAAAVDEALRGLRDAARPTPTSLHATVACAKVGVTTGEWAGALREVFGEYRAPTGVSGAVAHGRGQPEIGAVRDAVRRTSEELGSRLRFLVGKPGLDGHSNGAEQIAVRARDCGFEVVYQGIRLTASQIVSAAVEEDVHVIGLSILSGSHMRPSGRPQGPAGGGVGDVPVVVGGIIPDGDARG
jgi:(2R)-ethylmalonyl-CoA mutase